MFYSSGLQQLSFSIIVIDFKSTQSYDLKNDTLPNERLKSLTTSTICIYHQEERSYARNTYHTGRKRKMCTSQIVSWYKMQSKGRYENVKATDMYQMLISGTYIFIYISCLLLKRYSQLQIVIFAENFSFNSFYCVKIPKFMKDF